MKKWVWTPPARTRVRKRPPLKRGTALQIARKADRLAKPLSGVLRDEIIATQMPAAGPPRYEPTFSGWTTDEKLAFHERGMVPERYRKACAS